MSFQLTGKFVSSSNDYGGFYTRNDWFKGKQKNGAKLDFATVMPCSCCRRL